jgi:hypothetical protein
MGAYARNVREPLYVGTFPPVTNATESSSNATRASVGDMGVCLYRHERRVPKSATDRTWCGGVRGRWSPRSRPIGRVADTGDLDNIWRLARGQSPDQTHVWGNQSKNGCKSKGDGVYVH